MESNHGSLCCQCVSGWHLQKYLPLLALLMVYDHIECFGERVSSSFTVTHFVTQPTPLLSFQHSHLKTLTPHSPTQSGVYAMNLTLVLEMGAIANEEARHSGHVHTRLPRSTENFSHCCQA